MKSVLIAPKVILCLGLPQPKAELAAWAARGEHPAWLRAEGAAERAWHGSTPPQAAAAALCLPAALPTALRAAPGQRRAGLCSYCSPLVTQHCLPLLGHCHLSQMADGSLQRARGYLCLLGIITLGNSSETESGYAFFFLLLTVKWGIQFFKASL